MPLRGIDVDRPNAARMYDYLLGGAHNFDVDRELVRRLIDAYPNAAHNARANRAFLGRAVRWCLDHGIDQFLDLGSGVPTVGNVHEIAHQRNPAARIAYVDFEPVAVAHAEEIIAKNGLTDTVTITRADLRDPDTVLTAPGVAEHLDLDRPVALLMVSVLHFVADDENPRAILRRYRDALSAGGVLVFSHISHDHEDAAFGRGVRAAADVYRDSATPGHPRSRAQLRDLLGGVNLVAPGLVDVIDWPEHQDGGSSGNYGAVGHLRPDSELSGDADQR